MRSSQRIGSLSHPQTGFPSCGLYILDPRELHRKEGMQQFEELGPVGRAKFSQVNFSRQKSKTGEMTKPLEYRKCLGTGKTTKSVYKGLCCFSYFFTLFVFKGFCGFSCFHTFSYSRGFVISPVSGHFPYSRDFVASPVSMHFPYSGGFVVSPVSRHFPNRLLNRFV